MDHSNNGHNSRTCTTRGGCVKLPDGSIMKESASMGNLSPLDHSSSPANLSPNPSSPATSDGYFSDDPAYASCSAKRCANRNKVMMASASNLKQQERDWLDLPSDVMANILKRIGMADILENAQKVCTAWHKIYKDPAMWRVIYMNALWGSTSKLSVVDMCKCAVDRSQGQLVDITLVYPYDADLLLYVADRSSQLRRLQLVSGVFFRSLTTDALTKFPLLEELNLYSIIISKGDIETVGLCCPMLKTLKVNRKACGVQAKLNLYTRDTDAEPLIISSNEIALAIGQNLLELRHLELIGNYMTNTGLQVILDNCHHLETLDLRECWYINLKGNLGKQCSKQIKNLKLPNDSLEGCLFVRGTDTETIDEDYFYFLVEYGCGYDSSKPYDIYLYRLF